MAWISYQSKRRCTKTRRCHEPSRQGSVTSQNDAAPKRAAKRPEEGSDQLPVKTTLHQNSTTTSKRTSSISYQSKRRCTKTQPPVVPFLHRSVTSQNDAAPKLSVGREELTADQLPVKTTLHQNLGLLASQLVRISYQSKRRCTKTGECSRADHAMISYQSKRRCTKTQLLTLDGLIVISYQSKRRCTKTGG